jgi:hypothetical protein
MERRAVCLRSKREERERIFKGFFGKGSYDVKDYFNVFEDYFNVFEEIDR